MERSGCAKLWWRKVNSVVESFTREETGALLGWKNEKGETELLISVDNYEHQSGRALEVLTLEQSGSVRAKTNWQFGERTVEISEVDGQFLFVPGQPVCAPRLSDGCELLLLTTRGDGAWVRDSKVIFLLPRQVGTRKCRALGRSRRRWALRFGVACEIGALRISVSRRKLRERTADWKLEQITGLRQSVAAA